MPYFVKWRKKRLQRSNLFTYGVLIATAIGLVLWYCLTNSQEALFCLCTTTNGEDLKYLTLRHVNCAKHSIFLASYGCGDPHVLPLLTAKARQGLDVQVLCDRKLKPKLPDALCQIDKRSGLMHRKVIVTDDRHLLFSSSNTTESSLKMHHNLLIKMDHPSLARAVKENYPFFCDSWSFYPLPEAKKDALDHLLKLLYQAEKEIILAMYTLTHPKLIEALIAAAKRGVKVQVILDYGMAKGTCRGSVKRLRHANIPLLQSREGVLFHYKCAKIDMNFVMGSANWTKAAFERNREYLLIFSYLPHYEMKQVSRFFAKMACEAKPLQRSQTKHRMKIWRIPYFPQRFLSSCSWTPWGIFLHGLSCSNRLKKNAHTG